MIFVFSKEIAQVYLDKELSVSKISRSICNWKQEIHKFIALEGYGTVGLNQQWYSLAAHIYF